MGFATIHSRDYRLYEQRFLPTMTQDQFINMWRTVYSFFAFETDQEIFTSLSRVGESKRENYIGNQTTQALRLKLGGLS